ncbi:MAG: metallophosphoesterase [Microthrixaceae bacterium]
MARFFTADLHLGHRNIARYEPERARAAGVDPLCGPADDRTQARLDTFLIDHWNEVVGPDDEVWLLGDAVMGRLDQTIAHLGRLLGRVVLVPGNHDRVWAGDRRRDEWWDRYLAAGIEEIVDGTAVLELADGAVVDVDHFPFRGDSGPTDRYLDWRPEDQGRVLLHGHVHSTWRTNGRMINVGVDVWDYYPVAEQQVIDLARAVAAHDG